MYPHFPPLLNFYDNKKLTYKNNFRLIKIEKQKIKCKELLKIEVILFNV